MITRRHSLALPTALVALGGSPALVALGGSPAIAALGGSPALVALSGSPALAAIRPLAIVMNSGGASCSVIDMTTKQIVDTLTTYREPSHWCLSPDRTRLYVCDASGNALFIFDPLTAAPLGHVRMADPYQLAFTPDRKYLVVNALRLNHVDIYDATTLALVKRFAPGAMPSHLDISPDSRWSFNSCQGSDTLASFDLATMTTRWVVPVGRTPAGVLWHNGKILVCLMGRAEIAVVDPQTGAVERRVQAGAGAHNLFLTQDRQTLYVSNRLGGSLMALDPQTLAIRRTYVIPGGPDDIGIAPDGHIWIALRFAEAVAVLNPTTGDYSTIPVGRSPHGLFLNTELTKQGKLTAEIL
ncbi:MAG: beta-propeller fold lactonase family protein [Acidocella sp.]|nr:beta-propeller fold lactonase family protein [Acidocella sp.]